MPDEPQTPESSHKLYYSISEVSELLSVKPHVLRYWESQFGSLRPKKNRAGNRMYRARDVEVLRQIQELLHVRRYTIAGARRELPRLRHELAAGSAAEDTSDPAPPLTHVGVDQLGRATLMAVASSDTDRGRPAPDTAALAGHGQTPDPPKSQREPLAAPPPLPRPRESGTRARPTHFRDDPSQIALDVSRRSFPVHRIADLRHEIVGLKEWLESLERGKAG